MRRTCSPSFARWRRGRTANWRSSRSWLRASRTTAASSPAARSISVRVWRTESCRCAATRARSSTRTRSRRSPERSRTFASHHGASSTSTPASRINVPMSTGGGDAPRAVVRCGRWPARKKTSSRPNTRRRATLRRPFDAATPMSGVDLTSAWMWLRSSVEAPRHTATTPMRLSKKGHVKMPRLGRPRVSRAKKIAKIATIPMVTRAAGGRGRRDAGRSTRARRAREAEPKHHVEQDPRPETRASSEKKIRTVRSFTPRRMASPPQTPPRMALSTPRR